MNMRQYVVDAFTDKVFTGNPAAVCVLEQWIPDELMENIAQENNLSETAFLVKVGEKYHLRWFTKVGEINLCGHATMASSFVIFNFFEKDRSEITFSTMSGDLIIHRKGELYEMDLPAFTLKEIPVTEEMTEAIGVKPQAAYLGEDLLCVLDSEETVRNIKPDLEKVKLLDSGLLHITARGKDFDCVSRSFAPRDNVPEDPVCGRGHCHIIPYWANKLQQDELVAYQASRRGGILYCRMKKDRVILAGKAALFSIDELYIDAAL